MRDFVRAKFYLNRSYLI